MASYGGQKDFRFPTTRARPAAVRGEQLPRCIRKSNSKRGTLWHHLERHGIPFRNFGEGFELAGDQEEAGGQSPPAPVS